MSIPACRRSTTFRFEEGAQPGVPRYLLDTNVVSDLVRNRQGEFAARHARRPE